MKRVYCILLALSIFSGCAGNQIRRMTTENAALQVGNQVITRQNDELTEQVGEYQTAISAYQNQAVRYKDEIQALREERNDLVNKSLEYQQRIDELTRKTGQLTWYEVVNGDCLWNIAKKPSIYGDPWEWPLIFFANRDQIENENLIFPRQRLSVPR